MPEADETAKVKLFYYLIGESGRELCNTLISSSESARRKVSKMMKKFDEHYTLKVYETVERYCFF